jgi:hypothetical protein
VNNEEDVDVGEEVKGGVMEGDVKEVMLMDVNKM